MKKNELTKKNQALPENEGHAKANSEISEESKEKETASKENTDINNPNSEATPTKKDKKGSAKLAILLILPFLLFSFGVGLISVYVFKEYVESSNIWRFAVNTNAVATPEANGGEDVQSDGEIIGGSMAEHSIEPVSKPDKPSEDPSENSTGNDSEPPSDASDDPSDEPSEDPEQIYYNKKDFPGYSWGELWAKLSIPAIGLEEKNVYVGESNAIYKKGIGKRFGTRFPGQGGNIVLGAHVTREFYDLSELQVGDLVYIKTGYGDYVYEVYETFIFSNQDYEYVMNYDEGEKLTLYTCHPRGSAYRTERFGVLCKKISGPEWIEVD